jgi:hypothetical protein
MRATSSLPPLPVKAGWRGRQALSGCKAVDITGSRVVNACNEKQQKRTSIEIFSRQDRD